MQSDLKTSVTGIRGLFDTCGKKLDDAGALGILVQSITRLHATLDEKDTALRERNLACYGHPFANVLPREVRTIAVRSLTHEIGVEEAHRRLINFEAHVPAPTLFL